MNFLFEQPLRGSTLSQGEKTLAQRVGVIAGLDESFCLNKKSGHQTHQTIESFMFSHGQVFYKYVKKPSQLGPLKACFRNAAKRATANGRYVYTEGIALSHCKKFHFHHAWLVSSEGEIFDPTWEKPGSAYFGVPFETAFLKQYFPKHSFSGLLDAGKGMTPLAQGRVGGFRAQMKIDARSNEFLVAIQNEVEKTSLQQPLLRVGC